MYLLEKGKKKLRKGADETMMDPPAAVHYAGEYAYANPRDIASCPLHLYYRDSFVDKWRLALTSHYIIP